MCDAPHVTKRHRERDDTDRREQRERLSQPLPGQ
jgi:hypothetical protein